MNFDKQGLIKDMAKEMARYDKLKEVARLKGKRSKAKFNFNKIGLKYGLDSNGYFLDMFASQIKMLKMEEMFSNDDQESYEKLSEKAFEMKKLYLEEELNIAI